MLLALALAACGSDANGGPGGDGGTGGGGGTGGSGGGTPPVDPFEPPTGEGVAPAPTEVGKPFGDPVVRTIGTEGGTLTYEGGPTLRIPPGALTEEVEISIQLIEGMAPNRLGDTYEFGPEGLEFSVPVEVTFPFPGVLTNPGSAAGIGVAYQDDDGYWRAIPDVDVDTAAKEVVARIEHFSPWTLFQQMELRPGHRSVRTGQIVGVWAYRCTQVTEQGLMLLPVCVGSTQHGGWAVDGVPGGDATRGTLVPMTFGASYEAPRAAPSPETVTITTEVPLGKAKGLLFAEIQIIDGDCTYEDPCEWEGTSYWELVGNGIATSTIRWVVDQKLGGGSVVRYRAEGQVSYQAFDCTLNPNTFDIATSDHGGEGPPVMEMDFTQDPPTISFPETLVTFPTSMECGPDAPNRPDHSDSVTFELMLYWEPIWDEDGMSFSRAFDLPDPWFNGGYRFSMR